MNAKTTIPGKRSRFSTRRKALLGLVLIALAIVGWLQYVGAAGISGIATRDMDWNADGTVTQQEIMQSFYSVGVEKTREGQRECSQYFWRDGKRSIRVDCRTSVATDPAEE
ncbi:MAG: EF-hand domain-containing protein [Lysobacteraceae bacterium]|nr:MAG: EF-hand domain-containing protein [Xanthomonadaceae bacterium]